jgi:fructose-specific component phosphotransferase system IIB-like protein
VDLTQTELPGIQALQAKVQGDATCSQLRQDAHSMVYDYRVYMVMTPQTDLVIVNDEVIHAEGLLAGLESTISTHIQSSKANPTKLSDAQSAFADYQAKVTAVQSLTSSQSATLLAQTPQGAPGNRSVFLQARNNLANEYNDLHVARSDLAGIISDLS